MNFKIILFTLGIPIITASLSIIYSVKKNIKTESNQKEFLFFTNDS